MKLKIEKLSHGTIRVEMTAQTSAKPIVVELTPEQVPLLMSMLETARKAERFSFQLEL